MNNLDIFYNYINIRYIRVIFFVLLLMLQKNINVFIYIYIYQMYIFFYYKIIKCQFDVKNIFKRIKVKCIILK